MKKFEINIKEINLNDDFEPIEDKHMVNAFIYDETELSDKFLQLQLENKWDELIEKYLIKRNETPFKKSQTLADYTKQVRKEVCDKVREKFNEIIFDSSTIDEILDQIQGG